MTEQEMGQLMAALTRSREQFISRRSSVKTPKRMKEREHDILDAFRNR